jgi:hypothetical protein
MGPICALRTSMGSRLPRAVRAACSMVCRQVPGSILKIVLEAVLLPRGIAFPSRGIVLFNVISSPA